MKSMTGYGRGECERDGRLFTVEIKTVNHRYFEPSIRMSRKLAAMETFLRSLLKERIARGKTDVYISYENLSDEPGEVLIHSGRLEEYLTALRREGEKYGLEDDLTLSKVLQLPDVMTTREQAEDEDRVKELLKETVLQALAALDAMREKEGAALKEDLLKKLEDLEAARCRIADRAPYVVFEYKEKLYSRIRELLDKEIRHEAERGR